MASIFYVLSCIAIIKLWLRRTLQLQQEVCTKYLPVIIKQVINSL